MKYIIIPLFVGVITQCIKFIIETIKTKKIKEYKGIKFLKENYEAEHTVGIDDAIDDLKQVCINNGGNIK